jgi:hypothetical protein
MFQKNKSPRHAGFCFAGSRKSALAIRRFLDPFGQAPGPDELLRYARHQCAMSNRLKIS